MVWDGSVPKLNKNCMYALFSLQMWEAGEIETGATGWGPQHTKLIQLADPRDEPKQIQTIQC